MSSKSVIFLGILATVILSYFCIKLHLPDFIEQNSKKEKNITKNIQIPIPLKNLEENQTKEENVSKESNITKTIRALLSEEKEIEEVKEVNESNISREIFNIESEIKEKLLSTPIEFKFASAILTKKSKKILKEIAKELKQLRNIKIEVAGYTDAKGNQYFNKDLSLKRAKSVRRFLIKEGIDKNIITAAGYGESNFIYDKYDKRNRRVEIHIIRGN